MAQRVKRLPPMWETLVRSLGQEDPLEKEMATHSSILAWRIPWTEDPGSLQLGSQRVGHTTKWLHFHFYLMSYQLENDALSDLRKVQMPSLKSPPLHCAFQFLLILRYALVLYSSSLYQFCWKTTLVSWIPFGGKSYPPFHWASLGSMCVLPFHPAQ